MLVNRVNTNFNNYTFKASVSRELFNEILEKGIHLEQIPCQKRHVSLSSYISYVREIANTIPEAHVKIDKENPLQYVIEIGSENFHYPRNKDKEYYQYKSLRERLKQLEKPYIICKKLNERQNNQKGF